MRRFEGRRAAVTGAGSGIGEATAVRFAAEGARVGLMGRTRAKLERVATSIRDAGGECLVLPCDVSRERDVEAAFRRVADAWGGVDAVVAVAGIEPFGLPQGEGDDRIDQLDLGRWEEIISVNLTGMFLTLKHAVRLMKGGDGGAIVVTGSPTGLLGFAVGQVGYSASKAGCHGLARVVANEVRRDGIRVNLVIPGMIDTPLISRFLAVPEDVDRITSRLPAARPGRPEEVAAMNLWLCSDEASYCCGGTFVVDGGQTAV